MTLKDILFNLMNNKTSVNILFRAHPELVVSGQLVNFELEHRTYTVLRNNKIFIVNMDDVSMLEAGA